MPISLELWLAFAAAAAVLIAIPGPTTLMVLGHTVASGWRVGLVSLAGVMFGDTAPSRFPCWASARCSPPRPRPSW